MCIIGCNIVTNIPLLLGISTYSLIPTLRLNKRDQYRLAELVQDSILLSTIRTTVLLVESAKLCALRHCVTTC